MSEDPLETVEQLQRVSVESLSEAFREGTTVLTPAGRTASVITYDPRDLEVTVQWPDWERATFRFPHVRRVIVDPVEMSGEWEPGPEGQS